MRELTIFPQLFAPTKEGFAKERRNLERRDVVYYLQLMDSGTGEILGHLVDISPGGFKMDSRNPLPVNTVFRFRIDLPYGVADQPSIVFLARSKWCNIDPLDPFVHNIGFELTNISPGCYEIFKRLMEQFGRPHENKPLDLRRSNLW